jgi:predicted DNA-binding transcriptional regulator AlpA
MNDALKKHRRTSSFYLQEEVYLVIKQQADKLGLTQSQLIEILIKKAFPDSFK